MTNTWQLIDMLLNSPVNAGTYRALFSGKPGIGKTVTPIKTLRANGTTVYVLTITEDSDVAELRGSWQLRGNEFVWTDGPLTRAWRDSATGPVAVILNEIDKMNGAVAAFLHVYLDDHQPGIGAAELHLPTGEILRPTPWNIRYIATMNGSFDDLPLPIQSRFPINLDVNEVHPDALQSLAPDLRDIAKHMTETHNAERSLSIREFHAFDALRKILPAQDAAQAIFGQSARQILIALDVKQ